jgi:hypothetical protein
LKVQQIKSKFKQSVAQSKAQMLASNHKIDELQNEVGFLQE